MYSGTQPLQLPLPDRSQDISQPICPNQIVKVFLLKWKIGLSSGSGLINDKLQTTFLNRKSHAKGHQKIRWSQQEVIKQIGWNSHLQNEKLRGEGNVGTNSNIGDYWGRSKKK